VFGSRSSVGVAERGSFQHARCPAAGPRQAAPSEWSASTLSLAPLVAGAVANTAVRVPKRKDRLWYLDRGGPCDAPFALDRAWPGQTDRLVHVRRSFGKNSSSLGGVTVRRRDSRWPEPRRCGVVARVATPHLASRVAIRFVGRMSKLLK